MDEPWGYNAKWNKLVTKRQILYDSVVMTEVPSIVKFTETESGMVSAFSWGWGGHMERDGS